MLAGRAAISAAICIDSDHLSMEVVMALLCWKCIPPRGTPYAIQADASDEIIWATGPEEKAKDNGEKTDNQANGAAEVWEKQDHPPPF